MQQRQVTRSLRATISITVLSALLTFTAATVIAPSAASASPWMRVSCQNPDGSPAPSEGWTGAAVGNVSLGSTNNTNCAPGTPMYAALAMPAPAADGSSEYLAYTPPDGSKLIGGSLLVGLQANGYVDYLILRAVITAITRRTTDTITSRHLHVGALHIDLAARTVDVDGQPVRVSRLEFDLLAKLAEDPERVHTKQELLRTVWGARPTGSRTLDSHACRLRNRLRDAGAPDTVQNVWGTGYRLGTGA